MVTVFIVFRTTETTEILSNTMAVSEGGFQETCTPLSQVVFSKAGTRMEDACWKGQFCRGQAIKLVLKLLISEKKMKSKKEYKEKKKHHMMTSMNLTLGVTILFI